MPAAVRNPAGQWLKTGTCISPTVITDNVVIGARTCTQKFAVVGGNIIIDNAASYASKLVAGTPVLVFQITATDDLSIGSTTLNNCYLTTGGYFILGAGGATYALVVEGGTANIGIGTAAPAASAKLDITSTTGALLPPRMTTTQRNALTAVNGMIIYNSTTNAFNFYENGAWVTGSGLV